MNFFGHATVASWRHPDRRFVLGSMLPDFATMIGQRPPSTRDDALAEGIAFHHATDAVFHESGTFSWLEQTARRDLQMEGLGRGACLAAAHVGVELMLDDVLARCALARDAFASALDEGLDERCQYHLHWNAPNAAREYVHLIAALRDRAVAHEPGDAEILSWRIERTLSGRPRLALRPGDREIVCHWAKRTFPAVEAATPELVIELRKGLRL